MRETLGHRWLRKDMADHFRRASRGHISLWSLKVRDMARHEATKMPRTPAKRERHGRSGDRAVGVFRRAAHRQMWDMGRHEPIRSWIARERDGTLHQHPA